MQNMAKQEPTKSSLLGKRIKEIRKQKGFTQEQLAIKAGVAYTTLTKVENEAIKNPSFETVVAIAKGLEVDVNELIKNEHE